MPEPSYRLPVPAVQLAARLLHAADPSQPLAAESLDTAFAELRRRVEKEIQNPIQLYGNRVQLMFGEMVKSLGRVQLIQDLDVGEYWSPLPAQPADFLIVTDERRRLAVEVKNNHELFNPVERLSFNTGYLDRLQRHAELIEAELMFAVYLSRFGQWTLFPASELQGGGAKRSISLGRSLALSHMNILGDRLLGTKHPLIFRTKVRSESVPEFVDGSATVGVTIEEMELYCGDRKIVDQVEQNIAMRLMMFGNWEETHESFFTADGRPERIEISMSPVEVEDEDQPFSMIGSLSGMFSRAFLFGTTDEASQAITQIYTTSTPSRIGETVPEDYSGDALPLWRFEIRPNQNFGVQDES